ncbi:hypothetical protein [Paractinoplanes durhamensis]|uniref:Uncharacterized protein n=2 Tax=Paractinoplanes durhamensis TaxID=113563 RepID=A0ABQ3YWU2_9ACTN|nr:hypothetical protein [Actinoplanes durhamensis]GIE02057.1 hypothetical protein Adu01nite_34070 [Actinoplanes durhamensis]
MSGEDLVRAVLAEIAPHEVSQIGMVLAAYRRSPWPAVPDEGGRGHPTGAGLPVDQVASWSAFVAAFIGQVLATLVVEEGAKAGGRSLLARLRKPKPRLTVEVPADLEERRLAEVRGAALQAALDRGFPDSSAEQFADAVVTKLRPRRS